MKLEVGQHKRVIASFSMEYELFERMQKHVAENTKNRSRFIEALVMEYLNKLEKQTR